MATNISVTIAGVNRSSVAVATSMRISMGLESKWTCDFDVRDRLNTTLAYRPTLGQSVVVVDGATTVFRGTVRRLTDLPIVEPNTGTLVKVHCASISDVVDQRVVDETFTSGQLFGFIANTLRINYLTPEGVLFGTVASGPTMAAQVYKGVTLREAFNHLSTVTGYLWRITPQPALDFFAAGSSSAVFSLTASNGLAVGPVEWEQERDTYVNTVHLRYGSEQQVNKIDTFTGTAAGGETNFTLTYPALVNSDGHIISQGYVNEFGTYFPINGAVWSYNAGTNQIVRIADLPTGSPASFNYVVQFPLTLTLSNAAEVAANGVYAATYEAPDIFDKAAATELATGLLRAGVASPKLVRIATRTSPVAFPGSTMTLTFPQRMISGTYLVRDVVMTVDSDQKARYEYTFLEGAEHQSSWTDRMRQAVGRGGLNAPGGTISGGIIPNFSGRFDGDVVAHAGKPQKEVIVGEIPTEGSYGSGPGILMNRNPDLVGGRGGWGIVSDQVSGSRALWFQDRSQSAVAQYTWRIVQYGTNWYALHAATGVTLELGSNSNRLGKVVSNGVSVGPEIAGGSGQLSVSHPALPIIDMTENSGPVNQKTWRIISFGQVFQLQTVNDAYTSATTVMNVDRNGNWGCTGEAFVARLMMPDGIGNPGATPGWARIFVDAADGDLKVVFGDGVTKTIATDT